MKFVNNYNIERRECDTNKCHLNNKNDNGYLDGLSTLETSSVFKYNEKNNKLNKGLDYFDCYDDNYSHINIGTTKNSKNNQAHLKSILNFSSQNCNTRPSCHIHIQTPGIFINHHHDQSIRKTPMPKECFLDTKAFDCWETYFNNISNSNNHENTKFKLNMSQSSVLKKRSLHK